MSVSEWYELCQVIVLSSALYELCQSVIGMSCVNQ